MAAIMWEVFSQECNRVVWKGRTRATSLQLTLLNCHGKNYAVLLGSIMVPGRWWGHVTGGYSGWRLAGQPSGRHRSSVCRSCSLSYAPESEPETQQADTEHTELLLQLHTPLPKDGGDQPCGISPSACECLDPAPEIRPSSRAALLCSRSCTVPSG